MPKPYQIVPPYLHPSVHTVINDNTLFTDEVSPPEEPFRSLHFVVSDEGRDNRVLEFDTEPTAREELGIPRFERHGQPIFNVYEELKTQQAKTFVVRVMPEDASYANVVIMAKVKIDKVSTPKMVIRFTAQSIVDLRDSSDFSTQIELLEKADVQSDGFMHIPIMAVRMQGRGAYGNNFRFRVTRAPEEDRNYPYVFTRLEVLKLEDGALLRKETKVGSTYYDAHEGNKSLYLEDVVNARSGSKIVNIQLIESNFKQIYELYKTEVDNNTKITLENFDLLFGLDKSTENEDDKIPNLEYDTADPSYVNINGRGGILLAGGDDGSLKYDITKLAQRQKKIDDLYVQTMSGKLTRKVLSTSRVPVDVIMDAGYNKEVKQALIALILKREDAYGFIDAGIVKTLESALEWGAEFRTLGNRLFSKEFQHFDIREPYNGKRITVTTTYFLASKLPIHFKINGRHVPFQGELNARLVGYIKDSLYPVVDSDDKENKEKLYNLKMNYYEYIDEDVVIRGTAGTSQNFFSDLSEENNMHVLLYYKRLLERLVASKRYVFSEAEDRARFTDEGKRLIAPGIGIHFRTADIRFEMNAWEEERSILHCYFEMVFRTVAKRGILEIDINKRV